MAEYIKRDDIFDMIIIGKLEYPECGSAFDGMETEVRHIPSADVVKVKHGKWEVLESFSDPLDDSHKDRCRCTNCGFIHMFTDFHYGQYNFCPNCGARMDGE